MSPPSLGGDTDTNGGGEWGNKFRGMAGGWMAVQTPAFGRVAGFGIGGGLGGGEMPLAPHGAQNGAANLGRNCHGTRDRFRPLVISQITRASGIEERRWGCSFYALKQEEAAQARLLPIMMSNHSAHERAR
jgi:hypothetical protein